MKTSKLVMGLQHTPFRVATPYLSGVGQIMLQNNPWTGLLFLVGIFCGSIPMGIASLVSVITGTLTANVLRYDPDKIHDGLYGFSATLVGVALLCFFQSSVAIWIAVIVGSALATIIQHTFIVKNIPAFTLPFILVVWLVLAIIRFYPTFVEPQHAIYPPLSDNYLTLLSRGFGQVIFQNTLWAGMFFFIGILIHRPIVAVYALFSVALSSVLAFALHESASDIYMGLLSYNAVLCAIVFSGNKTANFVFGIVAIFLSVLIMIQMRHMNLPPLTFPFVLATWLSLGLKWGKEKLGSAV